MAEIVLNGVSKRFPDGFEAVKDMDLEIGDGEFMILVGPSGCGKSTALRMIAGLEDITEGEVRIGDRVVNELAPKDRDIAMVFQTYALYPHMTVRENMAFPLKLANVPDDQIKSKVEEAAKILDLEQHLDRKPANLSGAGFIGSPAMNFVPGQLDGDRVRLPFGEVSLSPEVRDKVGAGGGRSVIAGVRPETFEDAALVPLDARPRGTTFRAKVDLVESMGAEKYAYFQVQHEGVQSQELQELAQDSGADEVPSSGEGQVVARLDAASSVQRDQEVELWVDSTKLHLFDPQSGHSLTAADGQPAAA